MSQGYKLRFDQMRENDPTQTEQNETTENQDYYQQSGSTRNLCLVWPDGKRAFYNYSYLVSVAFDPGEDKNVITLCFSSDVIKIQGFLLEPLFMALFEHLPRIITATDERYATGEESLVTNILIENKDNG
ncbi:hypothetical protein [Emticicia soli]|uniref:Uncharacterized protein n=1 Tax=Emticicia soli TaxID=2027878 RepID=A0ABW5J5D6_9BACT